MPTFIDFTSKTFWLGALMVLGGIAQATGLPVVADLVMSVWNMEPGALISAGLGLIFVKDAIKKVQ